MFFFFFIITAVLSKEISLQTLPTGNRSDITVHKLAYYVCNNMKCAILRQRRRIYVLGYSELIIFPIELHSDSTLFGA